MQYMNMENEIIVYRKALKAIESLEKVPYSRDPLKFARNAVKTAQDIARKALTLDYSD